MSEQERNKYLEAYYANEADANKNMSLANAFAGVYMIVLWIFYLTEVFAHNSDTTFLLINIFFPVSIFVLLSPLLYVFIFKDNLKTLSNKFEELSRLSFFARKCSLRPLINLNILPHPGSDKSLART